MAAQVKEWEKNDKIRRLIHSQWEENEPFTSWIRSILIVHILGPTRRRNNDLKIIFQFSVQLSWKRTNQFNIITFLGFINEISICELIIDH